MLVPDDLAFEKALLSLSNEFLAKVNSETWYEQLFEQGLSLLSEIKTASLVVKTKDSYRYVAHLGLSKSCRKNLENYRGNEAELVNKDQFSLNEQGGLGKLTVNAQKLLIDRQNCLSKTLNSETKAIFVDLELRAVLIIDRPKKAPLSQNEQARLERLLEQFTILMQHRRMYEQSQQKIRELDLLERVRSSLATELDFNHLMPLAVNAIADVFKASYVSFYDLDSGVLVFNCAAGKPISKAKKVVPNSSVRQAVKSLGPVLLMDKSQGGKTLVETVLSEIAVPLVHKKTIIGVLSLESTQGLFSQEDFNLILAIRKQLSIAIERSQLFKKSLQTEKRFRLFAEYSSDLISFHDQEGRFLYVSPSSKRITGYEPAELLGKPLQDYLIAEDQAFMTMQLEVLSQNTLPLTEYAFKTKEGKIIYLEASMQWLKSETDDSGYIVSSARDITQTKEMQAQLEHSAVHDALTGLPNRALFIRHLEALLAKEEGGQLNAAVLYLDLDRFKITNDSLGHLVGDALLKEFSERLKTCVNEGDIVARLSGDEFAVLLNNLTNPRAAKAIVERINAVLSKAFKLENLDIYSTASIGMAFVNASTKTAEDILRNADVAMHSAKRAGGSSFTVFNSSMYQGFIERLSLEADLRTAIDENQLSLVYQPIHDLRTRTLAGFEALLRWKHPELGFITPDKFIPIAEETDLILRVDEWVVTEACRQTLVWQKQFQKAKDVFMSINLSSRQLMLDGAAGKIAALVRAQNVAPESIKLEVTEGAMMTKADAGAAALARLRSEGFKIQIDDFGTGYSSLSYLHKLPLDSLKIDRSFVQRMEGGRQDIEIIKTILALAKGLNLDVVAEGIETQYQLETLASMGTSHGQGYFIAKPLMPHVAEARFFEERQENVFA